MKTIESNNNQSFEEGCNKADCIYRSSNYGRFVTCDYLLRTHKRRGCGIGDACDKYDTGEKYWTSKFVFLPKKED